MSSVIRGVYDFDSEAVMVRIKHGKTFQPLAGKACCIPILAGSPYKYLSTGYPQVQ